MNPSHFPGCWPFFSQRRKELESMGVEYYLSAEKTQVHGDVKLHDQSERELVFTCLKSVKRELVRLGVVSVLEFLFLAGSTFATMRILKGQGTIQIQVGLCFLFLALALTARGLRAIATLKQAEIRSKVQGRLVLGLSRHVLQMDRTAFEKQDRGNWSVLLSSDIKNVSGAIFQFLRSVVPATLGIIIYSPLLINLAGISGVIAIALLALVIPVGVVFANLSEKLNSKGQGELDKVAARLSEWITEMRLIRVLGWESKFSAEVAEFIRKYLRISALNHVVICIIIGASLSWWMVSAGSILIFSKLFGTSVELSAFFGALWLITTLGMHFGHVPMFLRSLAEAKPSIRRIVKVLKLPVDESSETHSKKNKIPSAIYFKALSFQYPDGKWGLRDFNADVSLEGKTALWGPVGSGKSTFLKILLGQILPTSGEIEVQYSDGSRDASWASDVRDEVRRCLSYSSQTPFIASDTLISNIVLDAECDEGNALKSAEFAQLEADMAIWDDSHDREMGERGSSLSGGQKHRLSVARAHYFGRKTLILDNSLGALDQRTQSQLFENVLELNRGIVLVTHDPSHLQKMDHIVNFESGRA